MKLAIVASVAIYVRSRDLHCGGVVSLAPNHVMAECHPQPRLPDKENHIWQMSIHHQVTLESIQPFIRCYTVPVPFDIYSQVVSHPAILCTCHHTVYTQR